MSVTRNGFELTPRAAASHLERARGQSFGNACSERRKESIRHAERLSFARFYYVSVPDAFLSRQQVNFALLKARRP